MKGLIATSKLLALAIGVIILVSAGRAQEAPPNRPAITSACELDYPPFSIVHDDGRVDGFSIELMRAALAAMDHDVSFRTGPWAEVKGWLENGEVEALPLVGRTPEREILFDFTVPYLTMHGTIVVRQDADGIHDLADLRGRRVAVMAGDNAEEFLRREDRGMDIVTTPTFSDALQELSAGKCDAVVMQRLVAMRLLRETGLTNLRLLDRPIREFAQDFCFAVREGDRKTLALLNEGLAVVVANGTYRRLHAKWFAHLELPEDRPLVIGGDRNFPPFEFLDERGILPGLPPTSPMRLPRHRAWRLRYNLANGRNDALRLKITESMPCKACFTRPAEIRCLTFPPRIWFSTMWPLFAKDVYLPPHSTN